jgi:hypothetical protein
MPVEVFRFPGKDWFVCFARESAWGYETKNGPIWLREKPNFMPLLPLLEMTWPAAQSMVKTAMATHGVEEEFPFEEVLLTALDWESQHWPSLAISWLEQGFPVSAAALPRLRALPSKKFMPQRVRHKAQALAKRVAAQ